MVLCLSLNTTRDIVVPVNEFIRGKVLRTKKNNNIFSYPAGKAINSARAAQTLGCDVVVSGFCGAEDFDYTYKYLKKNGINSYLTSVDGKNRICVIINELKKNTETVINSESDFIVNKTAEDKLIKKLAQISKKASCCIVSGSLPLGCTTGFYKRLLSRVSSFTKVICDTSGKNLKESSKLPLYILKGNRHEFEQAFGVKLVGISSALSFASKLAGSGPKNVVITLGRAGSVCVSENKTSYTIKPSFITRGFSAVGCGDAYNAGLAYGLDKNFSLEKSLAFAAACAEANLQSFGSCFIKKNAVKSIFKKIKIKKAPL